MPNLSARIAENLAAVRGRIAEAAAQSGRPAGAITLVGVTKYVSAEVTRSLVEAGCRDLGESRPSRSGTKRPPWPICRSAGTWWAICSGTKCVARSRW